MKNRPVPENFTRLFFNEVSCRWCQMKNGTLSLKQKKGPPLAGEPFYKRIRFQADQLPQQLSEVSPVEPQPLQPPPLKSIALSSRKP